MAEDADVPEGLMERLQAHSKAFESLLALTPAREYYGSQIDDGLDPSEQWNRKKKTKEEKKAAKKAKLDPANQRSALDIIKEREKKRKRELGIDNEGEVEGDLQQPEGKRPKVETEEDAEVRRRAKAEHRKEKRLEKKAKAANKKAKREAKKAAQKQKEQGPGDAEEQPLVAEKGDVGDEEHPVVEAAGQEDDLDAFDASGLVDSEPADHAASELSSAPTTPRVDSPAFDLATNQSTTSSSSSIVPPSVVPQSKDIETSQQHAPKPRINADLPATATFEHADSVTAKPDITSRTSSPKLQLPNIDTAQLQERLRLRIEELRARRKADGPDGKPARSRQELLEQRRKKEEQRKAAKKEARRKAKEEEIRQRDEKIRASSGSPLSMDMFSPRSTNQPEPNFSYSRLAFNDGTIADPSLTSLKEAPKRKGPQDPRTALEAVQKKAERLSGLDAEKKADIEEKDMWLNAKKRAHGERVRDDASLLKKALKRKEKEKSKSEKMWREREERVEKGKEARQKKREANLAKRREEKGGGKKGKKSGGGGGVGKKKKSRPGFEGRFKA